MLDWNEFDVFAVARLSRGRPLQTVTWALLQHFDLIDSLSLPQDKLRRFLKVRCGRGHPLPTAGALQSTHRCASTWRVLNFCMRTRVCTSRLPGQWQGPICCRL